MYIVVLLRSHKSCGTNRIWGFAHHLHVRYRIHADGGTNQQNWHTQWFFFHLEHDSDEYHTGNNDKHDASKDDE